SEYAVQAAILSKAVGRPVKVLWTRLEDMRQDYYRPAFASRIEGAISADGLVTSLTHKVAGPGIWAYNRPLVVAHFDGVDHLAIEGANDLRYAIPNTRVDHVMTEPNQRIGYWRSIGYSHNVFFVECFLDELAASVDADPYIVRRRLLDDDPRSVAVLETAAKRAGWFEARPAGRHLGIAFFATERWQTRVAQVADVSVVDGTVRVNRITCVADVGKALNPLSVESQLQGAVVYGLSAVLYGQIDVEEGAVVQTAFSDYQVVTLPDAPLVDVHVIEGGGPFGSVGEIGTPCAAPAVVNAVSAAIGRRIRTLPLRRHGLV
ncbi:MAG: molybdopterin cofactor-binding domain-containing protein, partial [Pseudomonadota bacterium]